MKEVRPSVLKISGAPEQIRDSRNASTQNSTSIVFDSCHDSTLRLDQYHDGNQIKKALTHRDVGDIGAPDLIETINHQLP